MAPILRYNTVIRYQETEENHEQLQSKLSMKLPRLDHGTLLIRRTMVAFGPHSIAVGHSEAPAVPPTYCASFILHR